MPNGLKRSQAPLYEQVADKLTEMIDRGELALGSQAPSLRSLSTRFEISISTAIAAYRLLEKRRRLEVRPQSGFYIRAQRREKIEEPQMSTPPETASAVTVGDLGLLLVSEFGQPGVVALGAANGAVSDWSMKAVHALMNSISRSQPLLASSYGPPAGMPTLRREVARWYSRAGCTLSPDDVVITCGALEAIHLSLRSVTQRGDTIAVESPTYWGILQTIETLGLKALEIPTHPRTGPSLDALEVVLAQNMVKAVVLIPTVHNPLGSIMPDENRRQLVAMIRKADVALIEDDIYADLGYTPTRPPACRSFDDSPSSKSNVIICGGFSKTVAPSLRIGWCIPGKWTRQVTRGKAWMNIAAPHVAATRPRPIHARRRIRTPPAKSHLRLSPTGRANERTARRAFPARHPHHPPPGRLPGLGRTTRASRLSRPAPPRDPGRHLHLPRHRLLRHRQIPQLRKTELRPALDVTG